VCQLASYRPNGHTLGHVAARQPHHASASVDEGLPMKTWSICLLSTTFLFACVAASAPADEKATGATKERSKVKIVSDKDLPQVLMETSKGDVVLELFEDNAPNTVANFVSLVEKGFYDGLTFHRVIDRFMAQGGDPDGRGSGGPGYRIKCECYRKDAKNHDRGVIAMAHAGRDTGGSQFYITFVKTDHLDGKHTVFGRVIKGMENVDKLNRTGGGAKPDTIKKATMVQKRDHEYKPETMKE
jgi:cyclophilin family peptidyl-prolyl cis-trans isomerase